MTREQLLGYLHSRVGEIPYPDWQVVPSKSQQRRDRRKALSDMADRITQYHNWENRLPELVGYTKPHIL